MARKKEIKYSFMKGTQNLKYEDYMPCQNDLMNALGVKTKQHYYKKRKGIANIPAHIKEAIEGVFEKYGITDPGQIWDITSD